MKGIMVGQGSEEIRGKVGYRGVGVSWRSSSLPLNFRHPVSGIFPVIYLES